MRKILLFYLFASMAFLVKAQIQPLSRQPIMRPIEPPHLQAKFTQTRSEEHTSELQSQR